MSMVSIDPGHKPKQEKETWLRPKKTESPEFNHQSVSQSVSLSSFWSEVVCGYLCERVLYLYALYSEFAAELKT